jgi:hypothetical protein
LVRIAPLLLLLSGCHRTPLSEEERAFRRIYSSGASFEQVCAAARHGKQLSLRKNDRVAFGQWSHREDLYCR